MPETIKISEIVRGTMVSTLTSRINGVRKVAVIYQVQKVGYVAICLSRVNGGKVESTVYSSKQQSTVEQHAKNWIDTAPINIH